MNEAAIVRVKELLVSEGNDKLMLRVFVSGGGCSGFQYGFSFDDSVNDDDQIFEYGGVTLAVDETSLDLLGGSEIAWVESLTGSAFQISNPNASSSCGCGSSFSI
ncbi:MAG: iron-sulfur cluster insertion protein ErpA, partial [Alphaproteobacteria bacterium]